MLGQSLSHLSRQGADLCREIEALMEMTGISVMSAEICLSVQDAILVSFRCTFSGPLHPRSTSCTPCGGTLDHQAQRVLDLAAGWNEHCKDLRYGSMRLIVRGGKAVRVEVTHSIKLPGDRYQ